MEWKNLSANINWKDFLLLLRQAWPEEWGPKSDDELMVDAEKTQIDNVVTMKALYQGDVPLGYYRFMLWDHLGPNRAHTLDVCVDSGVRQKGIGGLLMQDMLAECRHKGLVELYSHSFKSNKGSAGLHRKAGFQIYQEKEASYVWRISL